MQKQTKNQAKTNDSGARPRNKRREARARESSVGALSGEPSGGGKNERQRL
jgi:hypothetical protein